MDKYVLMKQDPDLSWLVRMGEDLQDAEFTTDATKAGVYSRESAVRIQAAYLNSAGRILLIVDAESIVEFLTKRLEDVLTAMSNIATVTFLEREGGATSNYLDVRYDQDAGQIHIRTSERYDNLRRLAQE